MNTETLNFVEHNLPFYGRLFQFTIDRLQKTDLTNAFIAQLINKLANVYLLLLLCFVFFFYTTSNIFLLDIFN